MGNKSTGQKTGGNIENRQLISHQELDKHHQNHEGKPANKAGFFIIVLFPYSI